MKRLMLRILEVFIIIILSGCKESGDIQRIILSKKQETAKSQRFMTRIEMVRYMHHFSLAKSHPLAKRFCAKRFTDVSEIDQCKVELFFYLGAIYYYGNYRNSKFAPYENVTFGIFCKALKILFGAKCKSMNDINVFVPYTLALAQIKSASMDKKTMQRALKNAFLNSGR